MDNIPVMEIAQGFSNGLKKLLGLGLLQPVLGFG
jgi:hypothetical protein